MAAAACVTHLHFDASHSLPPLHSSPPSTSPKQVSAGQVQPSAVEVFLRMGSALDIAAVRRKPKEWLPDACWLNVVALSEGLDAFRDLPDSLARSDAAWRAWCADGGGAAQGRMQGLNQAALKALQGCAARFVAHLAGTGYAMYVAPAASAPHCCADLTNASPAPLLPARYDAEAPEALPVPDFEARLSKFERMCIVRCGGTELYCQVGGSRGLAVASTTPQLRVTLKLNRASPSPLLPLPPGRCARTARSLLPPTMWLQQLASASLRVCPSTWSEPGRRAGRARRSSACCRRVGRERGRVCTRQQSCNECCGIDACLSLMAAATHPWTAVEHSC